MEGKLSILYDEEGDYLEIFTKTGKPSYGEETTSGITIFKDDETNDIIGIGILNFKKKSNELNPVELNIPFSINFSSLAV
ncbi:MAG: DUF2283 domain-containing protein [Nanoarchaeota archaeon]|nr:DUF2283 domain-containing protein [Nanoarchaeota archaeon]